MADLLSFDERMLALTPYAGPAPGVADARADR